MNRQGRWGGRRFSSPIEFPFVGSNHDARLVHDLAATMPPAGGLGRAVDGEPAGFEWSVAGVAWSDKMSRQSSTLPLYGELPPTAATPVRRRRGPGAPPSGSGPPRSRSGRRGRVGDDVAADGDETLFEDIDELPQARRARRGRAAQVAAAGKDAVVDALVPCLQRASGLPASTTLASRRAGVSATIVRHPTARSRCIVLRQARRIALCSGCPAAGAFSAPVSWAHRTRSSFLRRRATRRASTLASWRRP